MTLTNEQRAALNLALCEALGWTDIEMGYGTMRGEPLDRLRGTSPHGLRMNPPDHFHPLEGLGHCAAARKQLLKLSLQQLAYALEVHRVINGREPHELYPSDLYYLMDAGPEIQVPALLRTIGKMPEGVL